jgi:hypothetical protein
VYKKIIEIIGEKPTFEHHNLASIHLAIDSSYYEKPNITFSLLRRIALLRIPLAETITTRSEIIFVFEKQYLAKLLQVF